MSYKSVVIVREIWDTRDLLGEMVEKGELKTSVLTTRFEPEDLNALEMALKIKDSQGGKVIAIACGEPRSVDVLREALYRGIDEVIRVNVDNEVALDSSATAFLLAAAIKKVGSVDLVFTGVNIAEGENALLGAMLARELNMEHVSYVDAIEKVADGKALCKRAVEMGYEMLETKLPMVINVGVALLQEDPRTPRSAKATLKLKFKKSPIPTWSGSDVEINDAAASKSTLVLRYEPVVQKNVNTTNIDPKNASELKAMLNEVMKGN